MLPLLAAAVWVVPVAPASGDDAAPTADAVLDALTQLDPAEVQAAVEAMRARADALQKEAESLKAQAAEAEEKAAAIGKTVSPIMALMPASEDAEGKAQSAMAKAEPEAPKVTFINDVLPIFEARCLRCHRDDRRRGGLSLASFVHAMEGGSSGEVVLPGDPEGSRLVRLVLQSEDPKMPPKGKPLDEDQIQVIEEWIKLGAPRDPGSKVVLAKETKPLAPEEIFVAADLDGPPPMPEVVLAAPHPARERAVVARSIAASPTAPLVAIGSDRQILLYNVENFQLLGALAFPEGDVYAMTFSLNGQLLLVAGGEEGASASAVLFDVRKGERIGSYGRGYDTILAADISPDHRMIALGGPDRTVRVYATETGQKLYELGQHTDWIYSIKFSPDGELLATADRAGNLLLWQAANGRPVEPLRGHDGAIHDLAFTFDSNVLASAGEDGRIFYWDTWKYRQIRKFNAHGGGVLAVQFNRNNELVSSGKDGLTERWDLNGKNIGKYESLGDWVYRTTFSNDGSTVLSGGWSGTIAAWNVADGARLATLTTNPPPAEAEKNLQVASNDATNAAVSGGS